MIESLLLFKILSFIVMLLVLVLIHEAGHFFMAKRFGIKVEEFGFGFPPRAFSIKKGETVYSINWLPIGGFVKLYGEDDAGGGKFTTKGVDTKLPDEHKAFYARPVWQRAFVVLAGVVMNFILGIALVSYIFTQGVVMPSGQVRITDIEPGSPAATAGLTKDEVITNVDDKAVTTVSELQAIIQPKTGKPVKLTVKSGEKVQSLTIVPKEAEVDGQKIGRIGVVLTDLELKKYSWYQAPVVGFVESMKLSGLTVASLGGMLWDWITAGKSPEGVGSPVAVAQLTGQAVDLGLNAYLSLAALLSLNLAILNVLPIPALDGGRLFFILFEGITKKKVSPKIESYTHMVGMAVLLALMAVLMFRDVVRLISGQPILPTP